MKISCVPLVILFFFIGTVRLFGQNGTNCFLQDYYPKYVSAPLYVDSVKTTASPTVTVSINGKDTLGEISNYIFGNAVAVWVATDVNNPTLMNYLQLLAPTLIRYPGGSWSDIFFWNGNPGDLPDTVIDATSYYSGSVAKDAFYPQFGANVHPTPSSYYSMRGQLGTQGLITVNYAYARYGRSTNPVAQAAHLAADWVRYDKGRTEFWEIGNENNRPWEFGFFIDTTKNKDGQPAVISGDLYGKHFKIFVDSMKSAAAEIGATIYIGGQVNQYDATNDWIVASRAWNKQFFNEVGDSADFYVIHDYYGNGASSIKGQVDNALAEIDGDLSFVRQDITNKSASSKPIALTEWNCSASNGNGASSMETSIANGMQAVALFCELVKNNCGMSARWLIANWDADGMFYFDTNPVSPLWNPRPDFYYIYYLQQFIGDHSVGTSVTGSNSVYAYATRFSSGHTGVVIINDGPTNQVVTLNPNNIGVGDRYYVYTLTGVDNSQWPQAVVVNGHGPGSTRWGPLDSLQSIPATAYPVGTQIIVESPALSVQYVLIDNGSNIVSAITGKATVAPVRFGLDQNYPNPFNPASKISYTIPINADVTLTVYDILGRAVETLVNGKQSAGSHTVNFDGSGLSSGVYFYQLKTADFVSTRKMVLLK